LEGGKDLNSSLLSFSFIFVYDVVWLEVSLALFTTLEVLSVVMYNLSCPNPLPRFYSSWLLHQAGGFLLNVRRILPSVGGPFLSS